MASVLRVTWERREVRKRVTPAYPRISSMIRISACHVGPPDDRPGTPVHPSLQKMRW